SPDFKRSVASLVAPSWNNPPWLCQHHNVQVVAHFDQVEALPLNRQLGLGDQSLKSPNTSLVATPIRFIRDKQHAVFKMPVKLADYLFPACNLESVRAEYPF